MNAVIWRMTNFIVNYFILLLYMSSCIQTNISGTNDIFIGIISIIMGGLAVYAFMTIKDISSIRISLNELILYLLSVSLYILFYRFISFKLTDYGKTFLCGSYQYLLLTVPILTLIAQPIFTAKLIILILDYSNLNIKPYIY